MEGRYMNPIFITTGLLAAMLVGAAHADDTTPCATSCAADLKECRKQADADTSIENDPPLAPNSMRTDLMVNNELRTAHNDEIQKRKTERYQACATKNNGCLSQCSPASASPKKSVILK
jgi:hypothetical protein